MKSTVSENIPEMPGTVRQAGLLTDAYRQVQKYGDCTCVVCGSVCRYKPEVRELWLT